MTSLGARNALIALALAHLACGGAGHDESGPASELASLDRTAIVALSADITGVNPFLAGGQVTRNILDQVFLRLFAEQADFTDGPPSFEPRLAESWAWSDDGRLLTLELNRAATWSDGVPVTSADVVWSFDASTDPAVAWPHSETRERIDSYRALDDHTIEIRFDNDYPGRLSDLNECPILPRHLWGQIPFSQWRQSGGWFRQNMLASGPFILSRWRSNENVVLERNPSYFRDGYPKLDRVVFQVVPQRANRLEQLLIGQVDFVSGLRPSSAARVQASEIADLVTFWHRQYHYIVWNGCEPPFDDPVIRRAMTLALDRRSLLEAVYGEFARVAVSPVLSNSWVFAAELEPWPWDPEEAKRLLASRGFADTDGDGLLDRDGKPLSVTLSTIVENQMRVDMATLAHGQLRDVGVDAELDFREFAVFQEDLAAHRFSAGLSSWIVDTAFDLSAVFHSESIDQRQNYGCYRSPEVDRLLDLAREQTDLAELERHLVAIQKIIHRDQPYTFLAELQRLNGVSRRLRGVSPNSLETYGVLEEWSIGPAAESGSGTQLTRATAEVSPIRGLSRR